MKGPFSCSKAIRLEHPGPPVSQIMSGSAEMSFCEWKKA
jgi:hypothetical protein